MVDSHKWMVLSYIWSRFTTDLCPSRIFPNRYLSQSNRERIMYKNFATKSHFCSFQIYFMYSNNRMFSGTDRNGFPSIRKPNDWSRKRFKTFLDHSVGSRMIKNPFWSVPKKKFGFSSVRRVSQRMRTFNLILYFVYRTFH